jgi:hypothetical protein
MTLYFREKGPLLGAVFGANQRLVAAYTVCINRIQEMINADKFVGMLYYSE